MANLHKGQFKVERGKSSYEFFPLDKSYTNDSSNGVPKNTSKETIAKFGKYSKNLLKSTRNLTVDVVSGYVPNANEFGTSLVEVARLAKSEIAEKLRKIKDNAANSQDKDSKTTINKFLDTVKDYKNDAIKRLKSGELYKTDQERMDESMKDMFGDLDIGGDTDSSFDFGDFSDFGDSGFEDVGTDILSDPTTSLSSEPFGEVSTTVTRKRLKVKKPSASKPSKKSSPSIKGMSMPTSSGNVTIGDEMVGNIISGVGQAVLDQQSQLWSKDFAGAELRHTQILNVQKNILNTVNAISDHLANVESTSASAAMEYQGKMIAFQQEQMGLLKELKEISILSAPSLLKDKDERSVTERVTSGSGLNPEEYYKNIKSNISNKLASSTIGMMISYLPMLSSMGEMAEGMGGTKAMFDPMSSLLKGAISSQLSMKTKAKFNHLNNTLETLPNLFLGKMNELALTGKNPVMKTIGEIFGTRDSKVKEITGGGGIKGNPNDTIAWNRRSDWTLNTVIPKRLSQIVTALTGEDAGTISSKDGHIITKKEVAMKNARNEIDSSNNRIVDRFIGNYASKTDTSKLKSISGDLDMSTDAGKSEAARRLKDQYKLITKVMGESGQVMSAERMVSNGIGGMKDAFLKAGVSEDVLKSFAKIMKNNGEESVEMQGNVLKQKDEYNKRRKAFEAEAAEEGYSLDLRDLLGDENELRNLEGKLKSRELSLDTINKLSDNPVRKSQLLRKRLEIENEAIRLAQTKGLKLNPKLYTQNVAGISSVKSTADGLGGLGGSTNISGSMNGTLTNIYKLLAQGIAVYPIESKGLPAHLKQIQSDLSIAEKDAINRKNKDKSDLAKYKEQYLNSIQEINDTDYLSSLRRLVGFSGISQAMGFNSERRKSNSVLDRAFNVGMDSAYGAFNKFTVNGDAGTTVGGELFNQDYDKFMNEISPDLQANLQKKLTKLDNFVNHKLAKLAKNKNDTPEVALSKKKKRVAYIKKRKALIEKFNEQLEKNKAYDKKAELSSEARNVKEKKVRDKFTSFIDKMVNFYYDNLEDDYSEYEKNPVTSATSVAADGPSLSEEKAANSDISNKDKIISAIRTAGTGIKNTVTGAVNGLLNNFKSFRSRILSLHKDGSEITYNEFKGHVDAAIKAGEMPEDVGKLLVNKYRVLRDKSPEGVKEWFAKIEIDSDPTISAASRAYKEGSKKAKTSAKNLKKSISDIKDSTVAKLKDKYKTETDAKDSTVKNIDKLKDKTKFKIKDSKTDRKVESVKTDENGEEVTSTKGFIKESKDKIAGAASEFFDKQKTAAMDKVERLKKDALNSKVGKKLKDFGTNATDAAVLMFKGPKAWGKRVGSRTLNQAKDFATDKIHSLFSDSTEDTRSKEDVRKEYEAAAASVKILDEIESRVTEITDEGDMKADKTFTKFLNEQVKSGALDKSIRDTVVSQMKDLKSKGYPPIMAFGKIKASIREKYDKNYKKDMRKFNPFLNVVKKIMKTGATTVGAGTLLATGHPFAAYSLVAASLGTSPTFKKFMAKKFDKGSVKNKVKGILNDKAIDKYGVNSSPFDRLLGIRAIDKLSDKELEQEQKIAAATFKAIETIEQSFAGREDDPEVGPAIIDALKRSVKSGAIDKAIGDMIIDRVKSNIDKGIPAVSALSEAKAIIQKNYSKQFRRQNFKRSKFGKILAGFKKVGVIGGIAAFNPLLAAGLVAKEIAAHKAMKKAKSDAADRDEINRIRGTDSNPDFNKTKTKSLFDEAVEKTGKMKKKLKKEEDRTAKEKAQSAFGKAAGFATDKIAKARSKVSSLFGTEPREGSFEDSVKDKKEEDRTKREEKQLNIFEKLEENTKTLLSGLGIIKKGDINESDEETIAGQLAAINTGVKTVSSLQAQDNASKGLDIKGLFKGLTKMAGGAALAGLGIAAVGTVVAAGVRNFKQTKERVKDEGVTAIADSVFDSGSSDYNADGSTKTNLQKGLDKMSGTRGVAVAATGVRSVKAGAKLFKSGASQTKNAIKGITKNVAESGPKGIAKAFTEGIGKVLNKVGNNRIVKKLMGKNASKFSQFVSKMSSVASNNAGKAITKVAGEGLEKSAKGGLKSIPGIGWVIAAADVVRAFVSGFNNAGRYFGVQKKDVTFGMKIASMLYDGLKAVVVNLCGLVPGLGVVAAFADVLVDLIFPQNKVVPMLYKMFAGEDAAAELDKKKQDLEEKAAELGVDPKKLAEVENKTFFQKIGDKINPSGADKRNAKLLGMDEEQYAEFKKKKDGLNDKKTASEEKISEKSGDEIKGTVDSETAEKKVAEATAVTASKTTEENYSETKTVAKTDNPEKESLDEFRNKVTKKNSTGKIVGGAIVGATAKNPAKVKENPLVTNDRLMNIVLSQALNIQKQIKEEMVRHNGVAEDFFKYMLDYFETKKKDEKKAKQQQLLSSGGSAIGGFFRGLFGGNKNEEPKATYVSFGLPTRTSESSDYTLKKDLEDIADAE